MQFDQADQLLGGGHLLALQDPPSGLLHNLFHLRTQSRQLVGDLPYAGGIHRVSNPSRQSALSVHICGPPGAITTSAMIMFMTAWAKTPRLH
jgi:hypothetical protein